MNQNNPDIIAVYKRKAQEAQAVVEHFIANREMWDELEYYRENGKILGKCEKVKSCLLYTSVLYHKYNELHYGQKIRWWLSALGTGIIFTAGYSFTYMILAL